MPGLNGEHAGSFIKAVMATSDQQDAAYLFNQWANSPSISLQRVMLPYTLRDPYRISHYKSARYKRLWPSAAEYLRTLSDAANDAVLDLTMNGAGDYANALDRAMTAIYAGKDEGRARRGRVGSGTASRTGSGWRSSVPRTRTSSSTRARRARTRSGSAVRPSRSDRDGDVATRAEETRGGGPRPPPRGSTAHPVGPVAPSVAIVVALTIFPLVFSLWVAFVQYDFSIGPEHPWVGSTTSPTTGETPSGGRRSGDGVVLGDRRRDRARSACCSRSRCCGRSAAGGC